MAQPIKGAGTCMSFSAVKPVTYDAVGFAALAWTPSTELRVSGDLNATRSLTTVQRICSQEVKKILGSIDEGSQSIELGFDPANGGQVILHDAFRNASDNSVYARRTLSNGHVTYYEGLVSQEGDTTVDGDEVVWKGQLEINGARIDIPA